MKKKILIVLLCGILLVGVTGCGSKDKNDVQDSKKDNNGEDVIYKFNNYVQSKDSKSMASLFNEKYVAVKDTKFYNHEELAELFDKVFNDKDFVSYKVTNVYEVNSSNDFNKYYKESGLDYDDMMKLRNDIYGYKVFMYIADVNYNGENVQDIIYLSKKGDSYIIESSTYWSFLIASYRQ